MTEKYTSVPITFLLPEPCELVPGEPTLPTVEVPPGYLHPGTLMQPITLVQTHDGTWNAGIKAAADAAAQAGASGEVVAAIVRLVRV